MLLNRKIHNFKNDPRERMTGYVKLILGRRNIISMRRDCPKLQDKLKWRHWHEIALYGNNSYVRTSISVGKI